MPDPESLPVAWVLLGKRQGDNNQALALAELLGCRIVEKPLRFTIWRYLPRRLAVAALRTVDRATRRSLAPPWPALAIAVGKRGVPPLRAVRRLSGGASRIVIMGEPRSPPYWFDLVVTTPQYRVPPAGNVIVLPLALSRGIARHDPATIAAAPALHVLLVGGPSWPWRVESRAVADAARALRDEARRTGGRLVALTGRRTPEGVREGLREVLGADCVDGMDYRAALAAGKRFAVTADSASMLSDAIVTGRPVTMLPVAAGPLGRLWVRLWRWWRPSAPLWPRDLPRFWSQLEASRLVGTVDRPGQGRVPDDMSLRARVAALLDQAAFSADGPAGRSQPR